MNTLQLRRAAHMWVGIHCQLPLLPLKQSWKVGIACFVDEKLRHKGWAKLPNVEAGQVGFERVSWLRIPARHPVTTLWCVCCDERFYYPTVDEDMAISWFVESQPDWSPAPLLDTASYSWPDKCLWQHRMYYYACGVRYIPVFQSIRRMWSVEAWRIGINLVRMA